MNKSILIHNSNTPNNLIVEENIINFNYLKSGYKNIDEYISKEIISILKDRSFNILFIKDNLSFNYLELDGLRLAHHVRLSKELNDKIYIPIVILSDSNGYTLNKLNPIANILFTKNIFITENNQKSIEKFSKLNLKNLTENEYKNEFLNKIEIQAPKESNHNISNEWAIDKWSIFLGMENENSIKINRLKIEPLLYYKYLQEKYQSEASRKRINQNKKEEARVLFIDDKGNDGWNALIESYISQYYEKITFEAIKDISWDMDSIKDNVKISITTFNPHIIILDLRLLKEESKRINEISGIQILDYIKTLNKSIQIIMFTASTDSNIVDTLHAKGILGFVKKDAPTDKYIALKNSFTKLDKLIKYGLKKKYLKEIWNIQKAILELNLFKGNDTFFKKIKFEINTIFEILDSNVENKIKFTLITIFKVFEILTEKYSLNGSEYEKIKNLFHNNNLDSFDIDISQIVCTRNFLIHSGNENELHPNCLNNLIKKPNEKNILTWFKMLQKILEKIDNDQPNP